eukprot:IDg3986t1
MTITRSDFETLVNQRIQKEILAPAPSQLSSTGSAQRVSEALLPRVRSTARSNRRGSGRGNITMRRYNNGADRKKICKDKGNFREGSGPSKLIMLNV